MLLSIVKQSGWGGGGYVYRVALYVFYILYPQSGYVIYRLLCELRKV
jgi:hypothetical protein